MTFVKGKSSWNKGLKGYGKWAKIKKGTHFTHSKSYKKGHNPENPIKKGEHRGKKTEFKKGIVPWNKGKKFPKFSKENNPNWKGGISNGSRTKYAPRPKPERCEMCGREGIICYDHDHKTGKFRGWLCVPCNSMLGFSGDSIDILNKGIDYLKNNV